MMRVCDCKKWKAFLKEMDALVVFASVHGIRYQSGVFKYCPWCGKELVVINNVENKN